MIQSRFISFSISKLELKVHLIKIYILNMSNLALKSCFRFFFCYEGCFFYVLSFFVGTFDADGFADAYSFIDEMRLSALAIFLPAISKPVPWSGEVLIKSIPKVTFTPLKKSSVFMFWAVLARLEPFWGRFASFWAVLDCLGAFWLVWDRQNRL